MCLFCKAQYTRIFSIAAVPSSIHFSLPNGYTSKPFKKISQWELSEPVLPLPSRIVKNSLHCFPGWTWLQMSGEPDSCSAWALLAGGPLLSGLLLAGRKNMNGCNYSSLAWKFLKRNENCWPRLPPSSKTLGPFQMGLTGESGQVTKGTKGKVLGTDL